MRAMSLCHQAALAALAVLALTGCVAAQPTAPSAAAVGERIRQRYDAALMTLPANRQRHYAQRLYRITGDDRYLPLNRAYAGRLLASLGDEINALADPGYPLRRGRQLVEDYGVNTPRQRRRKRLLGRWPEVAYARRLAFQLTQARYHGLLNAIDLPGYGRALTYLASVGFEPFLTDPAAIDTYAAQLANLAYYLHGLGVADLRQQTAAAFRAHYPPHAVASLDETAYRNRLYGMTHFVIAASDYYQCPVDAEDFSWALDAFESELPRILATKADIFAEVGISFLLAGRSDSPALDAIRQALVEAYDPEAGMIPGEDGDTDLAGGEHRNVLAIMLLGWPERLHPGPLLSAAASAAPPGAATTGPWVCTTRGLVE
ncbi:MAG TPA: DUF3541 domain-containing protein [Halomonas sp.]|nr:DUF3541 domain-containing protein [Halomonas sp.]